MMMMMDRDTFTGPHHKSSSEGFALVGENKQVFFFDFRRSQ